MQFPQLNSIDWKRTGLAAGAGVLLLAVALYYYHWRNPLPVPGQGYQVIKQIITRTVTIPGPERIVVVEKEAARKAGIDIPPGQQVTTTADLPPTKGGYRTATFINMSTGVSITTAQEKKQPFLGLPNELEAGVRYGLSSKGAQIGTGYTRYNFLRVGKFNLGAYGEITTQPEAKVMIDLGYRW